MLLQCHYKIVLCTFKICLIWTRNYSYCIVFPLISDRPSITDCRLKYTNGSPVPVTGSINVVENNSFTLTCSVNSKPAANILWPGTGTSSSTLSVNRISRHQNTTYTLVAENTMIRTFGDAVTGRDTENFYFNVLCKSLHHLIWMI